MLDTIHKRPTVPPPPEASMIPRPDCGQCGCRIPLSAVRAETRPRGGVWFHFIRKTCDHCKVDFIAVFRRDGGMWGFIKTRMVGADERLARLGRNRGRRKAG